MRCPRLSNHPQPFREHHVRPARPRHVRRQRNTSNLFELTHSSRDDGSHALSNGAPESVNHSNAFHEHHRKRCGCQAYMRTQTEVAQSLLDLVRQQYAVMSGSPVSVTARAAAPAPVQAAPAPVAKPAPAPVAAAPVEAPKSAPVVVQPKVETPKPAPVVTPAPIADGTRRSRTRHAGCSGGWRRGTEGAVRSHAADRRRQDRLPGRNA